MLHVSDSTTDMFGGYADVAAYYYDADLQPTANEDCEIGLPEEYHPVWRMPDPWHKDSQCKDDFILIAEFSEIEGPKPLITIPKDPCGNFDLNEFSVRIMSVDSQSQSSDSFRIHNDTSVVMSEAKHHVYAYIHNMTLYDSKARGFVRPFCIAYVTGNYAKLQTFHSDIKDNFSQVSQTLREGNLAVFVKDMTHHLTDLQYTKERFLEKEACEGAENGRASKERGSSEDDIILESLTEESLEVALKEVKHILHTVNNLLNEADLIQQKSSFCEEQHNADSKPISTSPINRPCSQPNQLGEPSLSSSLQYSCSVSEQSSETPARGRRRSTSFSEYMFKNSSHSDSSATEHYQPKLVRTTNKRRYDKTLRTLHELCLTSAKKGINHLRFVYKYFAKDLATLKLERRDSEILFPNNGLIRFGRNVHLNFLRDEVGIGMKTSKSAHSDLFSDETASYASADSFLSCEDFGQFRPTIVLSSSLEDIADLSFGNSSNQTFDSNSLVTVSFDGIKYTESTSVPTVNQTSSLAGSITDSVTSSIDSSERSLCTIARGDDFTASLGASEGSTGYEEVLFKPIKVFCFADQLHSISKSTPGFGLLKFMDTFNFSQHVLFSILCGRPVIIIAKISKEETVKSLINTLAFFLTNHTAVFSATTAVYKSPVSAVDLKRKLIGVVRATRKSEVLPKHLEQMCSVLDLDLKVFNGPCYLGGVLTEVYSRRKVHNSDSTYLSYVHVILQEMAMKGYVFYHTFIQNVAAKLPHMYSKHEEAKIAYRKAEQHFLSRMKVSAHDTEIVKYLAEVMQKQIDGECLDLSDITTSTMDKIPCQSFKQ